MSQSVESLIDDAEKGQVFDVVPGSVVVVRMSFPVSMEAVKNAQSILEKWRDERNLPLHFLVVPPEISIAGVLKPSHVGEVLDLEKWGVKH